MPSHTYRRGNQHTRARENPTAAGNHTGWDLLLASCRAVFRIGVSAPVLLWGLACLLAPCLLEQLSSRQPKTHDARHPAKEDLAHAQATASCLAQQRLLVSYLLPLPPSYTNTKQLATSKHQMWWLATEMTDDGNRLLCLPWGGAATRLPSTRLGDWGPFAGSESSNRGTANGLRSRSQEGLLVYPRTSH